MILPLLFFPFLVFSCSGLTLDEATVSPLPSIPGHNCDRVCVKEQRYHCVFNMRLETQYSNCSDDISHCFGDGHPREVTLIADVDEATATIPANSIVVCHGDEVTVNVLNDLEMETCTIHWHGLHMKPFMENTLNTSTDPQGYTQSADGVPYVTQCPIQPGQQFTWYHFNAEPSGTFWFHSHNAFQRDNGAYGTLIIRDHTEEQMNLPEDLQDLLKDSCDLTEHAIILQEWYFNTAQYRFYNDKSERPTSILVNGKGRYELGSMEISWPVFTVDPSQCSTYRFRIISGVNLHCPVQFSIEDHSFTVIASDGAYIEPEKNISSLTLANGERYDVLVDVSSHDEKTYEMRFGGAPGEFAECRGISTLALLQYGSSQIDQSILPDYSSAINVPGRHINPLPSIILPSDQTPVPVSSLKSTIPSKGKENVDKTFYLQLGDNEGGANINNIQFDIETLKSPLLSQEMDLDPKLFCNTSYTTNAELCDPATDENGCACFHVLHVDVGDLVEIFLINPAGEKPIAHPIHFHGYYHDVIASGPIPETNPMEYVKMQNENGNIERNLDFPPRKDSIQTRPGEFLVTRFLADNPGYWIMHCHISFDVIEGQALVFKVGDTQDWSIPQDFPQCG